MSSWTHAEVPMPTFSGAIPRSRTDLRDMFTALDAGGAVVEARSARRGAEHRCPVCESLLIYKRGERRVPHFAHMPGDECVLAFESPDHLRAKVLLLDRFRELGLAARVEVPLRPERQVDLEVVLDAARRVAVEVQASRIAVDEMRERIRDHRRHGYAATAWVFTRNRCPQLLAAEDGAEVRVPDEIAYLHHRYRAGVYILDDVYEELVSVRFGRVYSPGEEYYIPDGGGETEISAGYTLKRTLTVGRCLVGFSPRLIETWHQRSGWRPELFVEFGPSPNADDVPF